MKAAAPLLAAALFALAGCPAKGDARVEGILLAQADGVEDPAEGATLAVDETTIESATVPAGAKVVRVALGRKVPWNRAQELVKKIEAAGAQPVLLVGKAYHLKAMRLEDKWPGGPALLVTAYVDGKVCVQPPRAAETKCVQSSTKDYIERAYLRELVREQVKHYQIQQVEVDLPATLPWVDAVRTIDGARTCCGGTEILVRLLPAQSG
jgi:hypothetical protein